MPVEYVLIIYIPELVYLEVMGVRNLIQKILYISLNMLIKLGEIMLAKKYKTSRLYDITLKKYIIFVFKRHSISDYSDRCKYCGLDKICISYCKIGLNSLDLDFQNYMYIPVKML